MWYVTVIEKQFSETAYQANLSKLKLKRESLEILTYKDFINTTVKSGALWS